MNEKNIDVNFTPEQGATHIAALVTHIKRMERKLEHVDMRIDEAVQNGDNANALKIAQSKKVRIARINQTYDELDRMREIFGGENGTGENK